MSVLDSAWLDERIEEMLKRLGEADVAGGRRVEWSDQKVKFSGYVHDITQNQIRAQTYFGDSPMSRVVEYALLRLIIEEILPARVEGWDKKSRETILKREGEMWPQLDGRKNEAGKPVA